MLIRFPKERIKLNEILNNKWIKDMLVFHNLHEDIKDKKSFDNFSTLSSNIFKKPSYSKLDSSISASAMSLNPVKKKK